VKQFGRTRTLSREEAIAIAYRAAGREADAQKAAEALDNQRKNEDKIKDAVNMWSYGYLDLARTDGLITQQDFQDAQEKDQSSLDGDAFRRQAPVQRQEMAFYLAKVLKLEPVYGQQEIFNSFSDWRNADPAKVPYIEAALWTAMGTSDPPRH
jgi:hypothetical protein